MRRWTVLAVVGLSVWGAGTACASQVFWHEQFLGKSGIQYSAEFTAAPWEANTLTMQWLDSGQTVVFRDATGVIGANPPLGEQPCVRVSQHEARCHLASPFDRVVVQLGDAGSSYRDLTGSPGRWPVQLIRGGYGNDDVEVRTTEARIEDHGGTNRLAIAGPYWGEILASNGLHDLLSTRNGLAGDSISCDVRADWQSDGTAALLPGDLDSQTVTDPGDAVTGCGTIG